MTEDPQYGGKEIKVSNMLFSPSLPRVLTGIFKGRSGVDVPLEWPGKIKEA